MDIKNIIRTSLTSVLMLWAQASLADTVTGTVIDKEGEPVIGGTVKLKDGKVGVMTDIEGNFTIEVPNLKKGALVFTYVGMADQTVDLKGRNSIK